MATPGKQIQNPSQRPLPPAGDERREELARRTDELAQLGEQAADANELHAISPSALLLENEIVGKLDHLKVTDARPEYRYCWVNWRSLEGRMIQFKKSEGWELVAGDDPECAELRDELGQRKIGDTKLMKMRLDRWVELDRQQRALRALRERGVDEALYELGEKYAGKGVIVHRNVDPKLMARMATRAAAQQIAGQRFNRMLQRGQVPGV